MRVGILSQWYAPEPGGGSIPTVLARGLRDLGHEVTVLTAVPNYPLGRLYDGYAMRPHQMEEHDGIAVHRLPLYPSHDSSVVRRVATYSSWAGAAAVAGPWCLRHVDAVWVFYSAATAGLPAGVLRRLGKPALLHVQDLWPESVLRSGFVRDGFATRVLGQTIRLWCRGNYRHASALAAISPGMRRTLIERGARPDRVQVVYNWVDESVFRPVAYDRALAEELGFAGRVTVMYAGSFGYVQGLDVAIRAAAALRDSHPDFQLVLLGSGVAEEPLRRLVADCGADNVRFLDRRPVTQMGQLYAVADAQLVSLSDDPAFASTIPSKTQAALACGAPVVMVAAGDAADLVRQARAGWVCRPGQVEDLAEAFARLCRLPAVRRREVGAAGRSFYVGQLSEAAAVRQLADTLSRLAGRPVVAAA